MAGRCAASAVNFSSSYDAMCAGSRSTLPSRCVSVNGPVNAQSIGTCWSSSMPASNAKGSRASSSLASVVVARWRTSGEDVAAIATSLPRRDRLRESLCGPDEPGAPTAGQPRTAKEHGTAERDGFAEMPAIVHDVLRKDDASGPHLGSGRVHRERLFGGDTKFEGTVVRAQRIAAQT